MRNTLAALPPTASTVTLPASILPAESELVFRLTISDRFNRLSDDPLSAPAAAQVVVAQEPLPQLTIAGAPVLTVPSDKPLLLHGLARLPSCYVPPMVRDHYGTVINPADVPPSPSNPPSPPSPPSSPWSDSYVPPFESADESESESAGLEDEGPSRSIKAAVAYSPRDKVSLRFSWSVKGRREVPGWGRESATSRTIVEQHSKEHLDLIAPRLGRVQQAEILYALNQSRSDEERYHDATAHEADLSIPHGWEDLSQRVELTHSGCLPHTGCGL